MKTKHPQSKSGRNKPSKPTRERVPQRAAQPRNSARYHSENGQHLITLSLGEGAFTVIRLVAHAGGGELPEDYALRMVCEVAASHLAGTTDEQAEKLVKSGILERRPALANEFANQPANGPTREIVLRVTERAFTILQGQAAIEGHASVAEMIGCDAASLFSQDAEIEESEAREMFGLAAK